ncbi:hypothetical protein [Flavobacterium flavigenum]|uniref:hypothetical protein n=1 Tax=Flavobacterium flavigenum TaxID=3003258 RepID=UPI0024831329|nr:hypothetical protein [Flavobacterium flavigenum]
MIKITTLLIIVVIFTTSGQEKKQNMIKNPYYIAEITSSRCSVELSVNGVPAYNHFEEANTASTATIEWPINPFIIENGLQHFEIKVMPLKNSTLILEKAFIKIKIFKSEAILEYVPQELVSKEIEITFLDKKKLPIYIMKDVFEAELPFNFSAWKNSVDLSKEDSDELYKEIIKCNEEIATIYQTSNQENYKKKFKIRDSELNKSLYLPSSDEPPFLPQDKYILPLPNNLYKLELYANGKLASVRMLYELPGFRYDPKIKNEEAIGFSLNVYFHRKERGLPLEIIR